MIKTVIPGVDYNYHDRLALVVDMCRTGIDRSWMQKRAAAGVFRDVVLTAAPGHSILHLIAMGASEMYGSNLNGDIFFKSGQRVYFPEPMGAEYADILCGIKDRTWTFEKYAKVYRDHKNTKKDKQHGDVLHAAYNEDQERAELLISVPHDEPVWRDDVQKMASGEDIPFSMSCFPAGTLVRTRRGLLAIETLAVGDKVLTHSGRYRSVTGLMERDAYDVCRVDVVGMAGVPLYATDEHPVLAASFLDVPRQAKATKPCKQFKRKHRGDIHRHLKWVPVAKLGVGHLLAVPIPRSAYSVPFDTKLARLAGYYIAEGSLTFNGSRAGAVQFTVHRDDIAVGEIAKLAAWTSVSYTPHALSELCTVVTACGTEVAELLRELVGRATTKNVPPSMFSASRDAKLEFMVGWFNGDGWQDGNGLHWSTVELTRALDLQLLLASTGLPASITVNRHEPCDGRVIRGTETEYVVTISNELSDVFAARSNCKAKVLPVTGKSKRVAFISGDYLMLAVRSVAREEQPARVYNIAVAEDESYTAYNLAVHNCKIPYDYCSVCGNRAPTSKQYCDHLKKSMTALTKSGHRVGMINEGMLFFDISRVRVGADRIAYSLLKAAGLIGGYGDERAAHEFLFPVVSRADDPYSFFPTDKQADYHKLAEIEKRIEAIGRAPIGLAGLPAARAIPSAQMGALAKPALPEVLEALAAEKISLALPDFFRVVLGEQYGRMSGSVDKAAQLVPGMYQRLVTFGDVSEDAPDVSLSRAPVPAYVKQAVLSLREDYALDTVNMTARAIRDAVRGTRSTLDMTKQASVAEDAVVSNMLRVYAEYERAWCERQNWDSDLSSRLVASHYVRSR